jgi:hypothetical protein
MRGFDRTYDAIVAPHANAGLTHVRDVTIYSTVRTDKDHLFEAASDDDALMIHSGTGAP